MKTLLTLSCLISACICYGQHCETYERDYFKYFLPKDFPDQINCIDSLGMRQGAWIDYKILYNAVKQPDELDTGYYVPEYSFGYYKNNRKINRWKDVSNVHVILVSKITDYYYAADTTLITISDNMDVMHTSLYVNSDSTKWEIKEADIKAPVTISCNKADICIISYRGEMLNYFDRKDVLAVVDTPFFWYKAAIKKIDDTVNPLVYKQKPN